MHAPASQLHHGIPAGIGLKEFVAMVAAIMAINALGTDIMLPALPEMGRDLGIVAENDRQWIVAAYMLGFGSTQLFFGPLADRYGRKPILAITISLFAVAAVAAAFAYDFTTIVIARLLMGTLSASTRVLSISIVRDRFSGRQMARIMSLSFIVFLAVPILAPSIGQLILLVSSWHAIFLFLAAFGLTVVIWTGLRLPETLHPEFRRPIDAKVIWQGLVATITNRHSIGYTLAMAMVFGALMGFINSSEQIFSDVFQAKEWFSLIFAMIAVGMGVSSWANSRIVGRFGSRRVSHTALIGFVALSGIHLLIALSGFETMWVFGIMQFLVMACFGLAGSNFGAMAMEPMGALAGTAASVQGFISTVSAALIGITVGQQFNGTVVPVISGFFLLGLAALAITLWTEGGRLFQAHHQPTTTV